MQSFPAVYENRRFALRAGAARDFLALTGWELTPPTDDFSFAGDLLKSRDFIVSRFWHPPARFTFAPAPRQVAEEHLMLLVVTEGELTVGTSTTVSIVPEGGVILVRPESLTFIDSATAVVCTLVVLGGYNLADGVIVRTGHASPDYLALFLNLTNAIFSRPVPPSDAAFTHVERAITELVAAIAAASDLRYEKHESRPGDQIHLDAVAFIIAQAADPATTVETVARELGVSRSHLFRSFQATGDNPSGFLRRTRIANASALLDRGVTERAAAEQAGFGTVRRMRRALAER